MSEVPRGPLYEGFNKIDEISCEAFDEVFYARNDKYFIRVIYSLESIAKIAAELKEHILMHIKEVSE